VLYSGKLEINKGADLLVPAAVEGGVSCPLVVVGDGRLRERITNEARDRALDVRFVGWLPRDQALAWVRHASALIFPSRGPESLSRVLLEAGALGVPIAAMDTGGTRDIIRHGETGLLSSSWRGMARDVGRLLSDPALAGRLGEQARRHVEETFDSSHVVARVDALYQELTASRRRVPSGA
jgi:glycosyltransferase involved in cell wall biosynthesis